MTAAGTDAPIEEESAAGRRPPAGVNPVVAAMLALVLVAAAAFMTARGIVTDVYPPFLPNTDSTAITRYSGSWLTGSAVAVLAAGVAASAAVAGFRRRGGAMSEACRGREAFRKGGAMSVAAER